MWCVSSYCCPPTPRNVIFEGFYNHILDKLSMHQRLSDLLKPRMLAFGRLLCEQRAKGMAVSAWAHHGYWKWMPSEAFKC